MTNYEYLMERGDYCKDFAANTKDEYLARFYEGAAQGFYSKALALSLEEAARGISL